MNREVNVTKRVQTQQGNALLCRSVVCERAREA
jgi:hypothetical protein